MEKEIIQFIGVNQLEPEEQQTVNDLATEYYGKLKRTIKNLSSLVVHVKTYAKEGKRKKFSIHTRLISSTHIFESTKTADWDLARTLHKSFKDLENEIKNRLHTDEQRPKPYS